VSSEPRFLSCRVTLAGDIREPRAFAHAFEPLMPALGLTPGQLVLGKKHRAFKPDVFGDHVATADAERVTVWRRSDDGALAHLHLRSGDDPRIADYVDRASGVVVPASARDALLDLVRCLSDHFGVVSANIAGHAEHRRAEKESLRQGVGGTWDAATTQRIEGDVLRWKAARTKLIRLSPITVIGPAIWATLPPMPAFDPMPRVTDLGDCKVLTAWPTLCEPRDPAFLRGTRDLRAWLWPYTIQNPADHVDNDPPR